MSEVRDLMRRFVEDRESLSEAQLRELVVMVRVQPALAEELQDQLIVDELLAQWRDLTRWHFLRQVDQRLRDCAYEPADGFDRLAPGTIDLFAEDSAAPEASDPSIPTADGGGTGWHPSLLAGTAQLSEIEGLPVGRWRNPIVTAIAATAAVALAILAIQASLRWSSGIATVEHQSGEIRLTRGGRGQSIQPAQAIRSGDALETADGSTMVIRFPDGTALRLAERTVVSLETDVGKRVRMERGRFSADVARQPTGRPMMVETPTATAEVLGTSLEMLVRPDDTQLTVTEGRVRFVSVDSRRSVVVSKGELAVAGPLGLTACPVSWPSNREGLVFLLQTNDRPNLVRSSTSGVNRSYTLRPRGRAHLDHDYAMVFHGGAFLAKDVDGEILDSCRRTNELTVEADIRPARAKQTGPARIVTFSTDVNQRDFTLGQDADKLIVRIRTPETGPNGVAGLDTAVCTLAVGRPNHVIVSYKPGRLVCYLDGRPIFRTDKARGDFREWSAQHLLFGDEYAGGRSWAGTLEGIAIFNRFVEADEAERNTVEYQYLTRKRPRVPRARVVAELVAQSRPPVIAKGRPDRSALVVSRYRVRDLLKGKLDGSEIYVTQWGLLDGERQPILGQPPGTLSELVLEPLDRNPQLAQYVCSDDFRGESEAGARRFFEIPQGDDPARER